MRTWHSVGISALLVAILASSAWADCNRNEAENLNREVPAKIVTAKAMDGWTADMEMKLEDIGQQFDLLNEKHTAAETADDADALSEICDGYRDLLFQIDELTKSLK